MTRVMLVLRGQYRDHC